MRRVYKRILNVKIERGHLSVEAEEKVKEIALDYIHLADLEKEERIAKMNEIIRPVYMETRDSSLLAIYKALYCLEEPEKAFNNPLDYTDTVLKVDHLEETEEVAGEVEVEAEDSKGTVVLEESANRVSALYKYDKRFIVEVKKIGFQWDGSSWNRKVVTSREIAYIINELIKSGFNVKTSNHQALDLVKKKDLKDATGKYISIEDGKFLITWRGYDKKIYKDARSIPSSEWTGEGVSVDLKRVNELIEYARVHDFRFINCTNTIKRLIADKVFIDPVTKDEMTEDEVFEMLPDLIEEE